MIHRGIGKKLAIAVYLQAKASETVAEIDDDFLPQRSGGMIVIMS